MRQSIRQGALLLTKSAAAAFDVARPPAPGVVVLAYHRVGGGTKLELDVPTDVFADQMSYLDRTQAAETLDNCVTALADSSGPTAVAVTFDDGTADFVDNALPALVANRIPATYYIATQFVEEQRPFPDDGLPITWAGLEEALSTGLVSIGSHTHSHAVLDKLSPSAVDDELQRSKGLIEDKLGVTPHHFAYPKGVFGGTLNEAQVARHHRSAALANSGVNRYGATNPMRLDRTPIQQSDHMSFFRKKTDGGLRLEGQMRTLLNRRRYSVLTN